MLIFWAIVFTVFSSCQAYLEYENMQCRILMAMRDNGLDWQDRRAEIEY